MSMRNSPSFPLLASGSGSVPAFLSPGSQSTDVSRDTLTNPAFHTLF